MNLKSFSLFLATTVLLSSTVAPLSQVATPQPITTTTVPTLAMGANLITRLGDSGNQAGQVSEIASDYDYSSRRLVTAVRTAGNRLKLISWRVASNGDVVRLGDSGNQAGETTQIDIAAGNQVVTASRTASGNLKLISWQVDPVSGDISRLGDSGNQAGTASVIKIMQIHPQTYVTAVRTASGTLKLISWYLQPDGSLLRLQDSGNTAGAISEIALSGLSIQDRRHVVTAVRTEQDRLKVILWEVDQQGEITRRGDSGNQAGQARMIRVAKSGNYIVTAVRTAAGRLKLISWDAVATQGGQINLVRVADSGNQAGEIGDNALIFSPRGVTSAVKTASDNLKLIRWHVTPTGTIDRLGDSGNQAGDASLINLTAFSEQTLLVTPLKTSNNRLKLISWEDGI
ncbi:MAG: hypothetical protein AAF243_00880 [Cyanobacteria bacterium P01_A01_bin.137]